MPSFLSHNAVNEMSKTLIAKNAAFSKNKDNFFKEGHNKDQVANTYNIKERLNLPNI